MLLDYMAVPNPTEISGKSGTPIFPALLMDIYVKDWVVYTALAVKRDLLP